MGCLPIPRLSAVAHDRKSPCHSVTFFLFFLLHTFYMCAAISRSLPATCYTCVTGMCAAQAASKAEPTVLALGVDGGFRTDEQKFDIAKTHRLVVFKPGSTEGFSISFPDQVGWVLYITHSLARIRIRNDDHGHGHIDNSNHLQPHPKPGLS